MHPADAAFVEWRARDGWPCRAFEWLQPTGEPVRGSLLFAGGRGDFIEKYLEAYAHWHQRGWNVTAFDWRGQGRSRGDPLVRVDGFEPLVDDLAALIADWRARSTAPFVAVAHSMGGHVLLRALVEFRAELDAAVLVAPMIRVNSSPLPTRAAPLITELLCRLGWRERPVFKVRDKALRPGSRRQQFLTASGERYEDEAWWWSQAPELRVGPPSWGWMRAAYRSAVAAFSPEKLRAVKTPLLLIASETDRLVSSDAIVEAAAWLPHVDLVSYRDAGHEILREADLIRLDAFARIDAFLDEHAR